MKSKIGIEVSETARDIAFCAHGILQIEPFIIADLVNNYGDVVGVASIAQDISDRFNAEKALQENEKKYRRVVDNLKKVIFQTDATGLWTFLNPAWTEITEFTLQTI